MDALNIWWDGLDGAMKFFYTIAFASTLVLLVQTALMFFGGDIDGMDADGGDVGHVDLDHGGIDHVDWAKWCDVAAVMPLTANTLGKLACGLADDALTTVLMALPRGKPCVLAPAMNTEMWMHPVVQRNLRWLGELGRYAVIDPVEKRLACGDYGSGGVAAPEDVLALIQDSLPGP